MLIGAEVTRIVGRLHSFEEKKSFALLLNISSPSMTALDNGLYAAIQLNMYILHFL
jgi:hypothetical protein